MEYHARCHCGRVRFAFRSPEITAGIRCNCSLCVRRGAVLSSNYIPHADFTPHADEHDLSLYLWNDKVMRHYFCENCGIYTYGAVAGEDGGNDRPGAVGGSRERGLQPIDGGR